jgi:hypothetical protein
MSADILLPGRDEPLRIETPPWARSSHPPPASRRVYAAAHVAALPGGGIDWDATLRFREHLWDHGFGVADAMDTAQRGMGLAWEQARDLILASAERAARWRASRRGASRREAGRPEAGRPEAGRPEAGRPEAGRPEAGRPEAALACGAGTDQLSGTGPYPLTEIIGAYTEQIGVIESAGAQVILMASRALAATARSPADYLTVYERLLAQVERPVILHWLGEAFDPALRGYWGSTDFPRAADTVLDLIQRAGGKIDGIKLSVLSADSEIALRRRLPAGVRLYTGDDFNYAGLIKGGPDGHSDALLGAFAAIAAPAAEALRALDAGDTGRYDAIMAPTVPLSRVIFEEPTYNYKAGIAFLAWLNGFQPYFAMVRQFENRRPPGHLARVFELAAAAGALLDPPLAAERMNHFLKEHSPR